MLPFWKRSRYQRIATADLRQITQNFFEVIQFMEKFDTIVHPPF